MSCLLNGANCLLNVGRVVLGRVFFRASCLWASCLWGSGMKPKVRARAAELNAEPELFKLKANITYLIKSKAVKISYPS